MLVSEIKDKVKGMFEGGNSIDVDWYSIMRDATAKLLTQIDPQTLYRTDELYGGVATDIKQHFCPDEVGKGIALYDKDGTDVCSYVLPSDFRKKEYKGESGMFTIVYENGSRFIKSVHGLAGGDTTVLDSMDTVGTKTGITDLSLNTYNNIEGDGAVEGTFSNAETTLSDTLGTAVDLSAYAEDGALFVYMKIPNKKYIQDIEIRLETDASNYYAGKLTTQGLLGDLKDGLNLLRFRVNKVSQTGAPNITNITAWKIIITQETGVSQKIMIDNMVVREVVPLYIRHYSRYAYIDKDTGAWKEVPENNDDIVNLTLDEVNILAGEMAQLVIQDGTYTNLKGQEGRGLLARLQDWYRSYNLNNTSEREPDSYVREDRY